MLVNRGKYVCETENYKIDIFYQNFSCKLAIKIKLCAIACVINSQERRISAL